MAISLKHVTPEYLPSGAVRYRFRRNGTKVKLRGEPGSPEFYAHYAELLQRSVPSQGPVEGSIAWLVDKYIKHQEMREEAGLASPLTVKGHKHHLGKLVKAYGEMDMYIPRGKLIELKDQFTTTPGAADNMMKSISTMYKWAIDRDIFKANNPAVGIKKLNVGSSGFTPWLKKDFDRYLSVYKPPSTQYLALMLAISTTARRSDLVTIGADHEFKRDGRLWLRWRQAKKPNRIVELPMTEALIAATKDLKRTPYLLNEYGKPFSVPGFGIRFKQWCVKANVDKTLHGIRKGISSLLPSKGSTSLELDVLLGHEMNSDETKVYIAEAERTSLALSVINRLDKIKF